MRSVASFAFLLLVLAASFDFMSWSTGTEAKRVEVAAKRRSHRIRAFSSGWNFPPAQQGITNQFEGALVDDRWYRGGRKEGVRVISIPADGGEIVLNTFRLLALDSQVKRFTDLIGETALNTTLVLCSKQNLGRASVKERREDPEAVKERRERAGFLLRGLGVRSNPEDVDHCSFIYICVRRPVGYVAISEKFSLTRGLSMSLNLDEDVRVYDDYTARTIIDNRWLLNLFLYQGTQIQATQPISGSKYAIENGRRMLFDVGYLNLRTSIKPGESTSLLWDIPSLCAQSSTPGTNKIPFAPENLDAKGPVHFSTKLAWRNPQGEDPAALQLILRVNGRRMGDRVIINGAGETDRWVQWEELFASDIGPIETLEIEAHRIGEGGPVLTLHLAEARLSSGELFSF